MGNISERFEQLQARIPRKAKYGLVFLLVLLDFILFIIAGGPALPLIATAVIAAVILFLTLDLKNALCGLLLIAIFYLALCLRIFPTHDTVFMDGWVRFGGNDPWYHMRLVENMAYNFPTRITFDPFTLYPAGQSVHFAPFFDFLIALSSWVVGWGSPNIGTIQTVGAYFPAILGALVTIPVFFIGKEVFGRTAGFLAAAVIAILPGEFLARSLLGFTDHHIIEVLLSTTAVMLLIMAVKRARENEISFSHIRSKDWRPLWKPMLYALLAGIVMGLYLLSWVGGVLFVFIIFLYLTIQYVLDHLRRRSTDYLCLIGLPLFLIALILVGPFLNLLLYGGVVIAALAIVVLAAPLLSGISRLMSRFQAPPIFYPFALAALGGLGVLLVWLIDPSLFHDMVSKFSIFTPSVGSLTVQEAQPMLYKFNFSQFFDQRIWVYFTTGLFIVPLSLLLLLYPSLKGKKEGRTLLLVWAVLMLIIVVVDVVAHVPWQVYLGVNAVLLIGYCLAERNTARMFIVIWSAVTLVAMLGQTRFAYYFAVNAALLVGYFCSRMPELVSWLLAHIGLKERTFESRKERKRNRELEGDDQTPFVHLRPRHVTWVLTVALVFLLAFFQNIGRATDILESPTSGPEPDWYQALTWMQENTPDPFDNPAFFFESYEAPAAGERYDYPDSAYGIMNWWDYGHWITCMGHRIPSANPHQSGASKAGQFFTAQNESAANEILDEMGTKYVIIEYKMATGIFHTMVTWSGGDLSDFYELCYEEEDGKLRCYENLDPNRNPKAVLYYPEYYQTMCARLYNFGGQEVTPNNSSFVVAVAEGVDSQGRRYNEIIDVANSGYPFPTYGEAKAFIDANPGYIIVGQQKFDSPIPLESLESYELVYKSGTTVVQRGEDTVSYVEIFEYNP